MGLEVSDYLLHPLVTKFSNMKTILAILIITSSLLGSCEWYVNEYNNSKIRFETMQEVNAPYKVTNDEKKLIIYYLENAKVYCEKKEYYETLIKFYSKG